MPKHLYLVKDGNDLVSHCKCEQALITSPPQMDCPWCGCGWLFTCMNCRMAFTFAKAVEVDESWEKLAERDIAGRGGQGTAAEISNWVIFMQTYLRDIQKGGRYVAFDYRVIDVLQPTVDFDGVHSSHHLAFVPQVKAMQDQSVVQEILANPEYWKSHAIGEHSPSMLGKPVVRDRGPWWKRLFGK